MRPSPEAVALAKAKPPLPDDISQLPPGWDDWVDKMREHCVRECTSEATIRILAAECDALAKERDALLEALEQAVSHLYRIRELNEVIVIETSPDDEQFSLCNLKGLIAKAKGGSK